MLILDMASRYEKFKFPGKGYREYVYLKSAPATDSSTLQLEKTILYDLKDCQQIVECFGDGFSVENRKLVYNLLLEFAAGGTLVDLMKDSGDRIEEWDASKYTCMLLRGLSHMHQKGYVHCDLEPDNILVFLSKKKDGSLDYSLKIADFGSAKIISSDNLDYGRSQLKTLLGVARDDVATDIWSLGCIVAEMLVGKSYVMDLKKSCKDNEENCLEILPKFLSEDAKDFLRRCLTMNKKERWTSERLLHHPFITEFDEVNLN
ncbi:Serine carboxypeptidase 44 [Heracleum sosnowskyi]|uniref:Serine carboxypeptidase 44 n=1 Tax=Heracleum sosnowskyi TaxID=360622 RepID=A0AAD8I0E1_9APIA|nr:Serine carboxypeptidase 44 [Heracleum sosnowskyi]